MRTLILSEMNAVNLTDWKSILAKHVGNENVKTTSNPREVLSILVEDKIQLLVIDYSMKSMSMFNSIKLSQKLDIDIITIVVSNNALPSQLINTIENRPDIILERPVRIIDMRVAAKKAMQISKTTLLARKCFIENDVNLAKDSLLELSKRKDFNKAEIDSDFLFNVVIYIETLLKNMGFSAVEGLLRKLHSRFKNNGNIFAAQEVANIITNYYISVNLPEKAVEETVKLIGDAPSLASSAFSLAKAYSAIGEHERSNQMLELVDITKQFSSSLHSIKALNHFSLLNHKEAVIEQLESVRWLNLDIDEDESIFKEYNLLSDYANAYLSCYSANIDYKLINSVGEAISAYDNEKTHEWVKEQLFEINAKTLIKKGDTHGINSLLTDTIDNNRSLLIRNKPLRERIAKSVLFKKVDSNVKSFFDTLNYVQPSPSGYVSQNVETALDYRNKAQIAFAEKDIDIAEDFILKARALYPDSIEINILHVEINIFLYENIRSLKLLEDSYKYLEKIYNSVERGGGQYNLVLNLLTKLDNIPNT